MSQREHDGQHDKGDAREDAFGDLDARDADDVRGGDGRAEGEDNLGGQLAAIYLVHGKPSPIVKK